MTDEVEVEVDIQAEDHEGGEISLFWTSIF